MKCLFPVFLSASSFAAVVCCAAEAEKKEAPPPSAGLALAQMKGPAAPAKAPAAPAPAKPAPAGDSRYELDGILVLDQPTVLIADLEKENARWLKIGDTFGELQVVSVDQKNNTVLVKISGASKTLPLKKATIGTSVAITAGTDTSNPGQPASGEAVAATAAEPQTPQGPATLEERQAKEAREFVSDLLEIGIQQRRAWEEKQAAEAKAATQ